MKLKAIVRVVSLSAVLTALSGFGATYTWNGGSGTWDGATANWLPGPVAWPNTYPNADTATMPAGPFTVTTPAAWTNEVNDILLNAAGYVFTGGGAGATLRFSGIAPKVRGSGANMGCSFTNIVLDVGAAGVTLSENGGSTPFTIGANAVLLGTAPVNLRQIPSYGATLNITSGQPQFGGGFTAWNNTRNQCDLNATVTNAYGKGLVSGSGQLQVFYPWGGQTAGGAADGGKKGVRVNNGADVTLSGGAGSTAGDRFIIENRGGLRGSSTLLPSVTRVGRFTAGGGAGAEAVLEAGAAVMHSTASSNSIAGGGTKADLLFGLIGTFNSATFAVTIGAGTPWQGLIKGAGASYTDGRLQKGLVTVNDGGGSFTEMLLRSSGQSYDSTHHFFALGNGADCPVFTASVSKVACRVQAVFNNGADWGEVRLDSTAPKFATAINRWIVGGDEAAGRLVSRRANGFDGIGVTLEQGGSVQQYNGASSVTGLAFSGASVLELDEAGTSTSITAGDLVPAEESVLLVVPYNGTAALGGAASPHERLLVTGHPTGHVTNAVFAVPTSLEYPELLDYDATVGFKVAAYDETAGINNASNGAAVKLTTPQTVSNHVAMLGLVLGNSLSCLGGGTDTYTVNLGRLADGSAAPVAPLLCQRGAAHAVRPSVDFGAAEGVVFFRYGGNWSDDLNLYGSLKGTAGVTFWGGSSVNAQLHVRGAANTVSGPVTVLSSWVSVEAGNGFSTANDVEVKRYAQLATKIDDTWGGLSGLGTVEIAASKTLTIANALTGGTALWPLNITGSGTLGIGAGAEARVALDVGSMRKESPRVAMATAALTIGAGARVKVTALANTASLEKKFDETFTLFRHNGTRTGIFAGVDLPSGFAATATVVYTANEVQLQLTPPPAGGTVLLVR